MARTKKKNQWFSSTLIVLISIFIITSGIGIWRYGWETVLDESLKYIIGASFTAIIIYIATITYRNKKKWL